MGSYRVTTEDDSIVIRLPRSGTDEQTLAKVLDYLELEQLRRRSQLEQGDVERFSDVVKRGAWQQVSHLFTPD